MTACDSHSRHFNKSIHELCLSLSEVYIRVKFGLVYAYEDHDAILIPMCFFLSLKNIYILDITIDNRIKKFLNWRSEEMDLSTCLSSR